MATDFVLKKHRDFVFALEEEPEKTYTIPALRSLDFEEIQALTKIDDEKNLTKKEISSAISFSDTLRS